MSDVVLDAMMNAQQAEASYLNTQLQRQMAEIQVDEFRNGIAVGEEMDAKGELELAESDLKRVMTRPSRSVIDDLVKEKTRLQLEQAKAKMEVLVKYSIPRRIAELRAKVSSALLPRQVRFALGPQALAAIPGSSQPPQCEPYLPR